MRCAICGQDVQSAEASVATSDGAVVHVACADRESAAAWARRRWRALAHALAVAVAVSILPWAGPRPWLVLLIGVGVIAHPLIHRRVWRYVARDIRTWLNRHWHA